MYDKRTHLLGPFLRMFFVLRTGSCHALTQDPFSKSLVLSQFNSSLEWLKHELLKKGFHFRTLAGVMSIKQRIDAL